jgi:hypothetical protein
LGAAAVAIVVAVASSDTDKFLVIKRAPAVSEILNGF